MRVTREETFGPVARLIPLVDEEDGLRMANDGEHGLASYIWTQDVGKPHAPAAGIEAAIVLVKSQNTRHLRQPFGASRPGAPAAKAASTSLEAFTGVKNVCISMGSHPILGWGI